MAAITAASVAATAGVAATITGGIGTYMSFKEVSRQSKAAAAARMEAEKATQEAKKRAEQNVFEALSLTKEPYERAREAALVTGAQAIEAGRESERGGTATAGRVVMGQNIQQGQIADIQAQEMQGLNQIVAAEDSRLKDYAANVSLLEAEGAQKAIKDAEEAGAAATVQGFQGLSQTIGSASQLLPQYYQGKGARTYNKLMDQAMGAGVTQEQLQNQLAGLGTSDPAFAKLSGVGYTPKSVDAQGNPIANAMTPLQFQDFMIQNPDITKQLIKSDIFAPKAPVYTPYVERPSGGQSALLNAPAPPVSKTAGSYRSSDLLMLPPELLKAYGIDPFSIQ